MKKIIGRFAGSPGYAAEVDRRSAIIAAITGTNVSESNLTKSLRRYKECRFVDQPGHAAEIDRHSASAEIAAKHPERLGLTLPNMAKSFCLCRLQASHTM